ncbi:toxin-antitoxin system YwqK family antitoxin [Reichenbachiella sp.]|uniref:toxin-antitoxin system YwqK family antitoxin n=1 Tax=Reichenbachiella sp. TaxID=2184521 RepID=UPI003BAFAB44
MIKSLLPYCLLFFLAAFTFESQSQDYTEDDFESQYEKPLTVDLDATDLESILEPKKKKPKRNVFYGKKTRKGFTRQGFGGNTVTELFTVLKVYEDPLPYVRDIYWYDFRKRKIIRSRKINKDNAGILHGPYKKMLGDQVIEEGIFYMGTKHGRWSTWNKHNILQTKEKYYKGWPKESLVAYHNKEKKQLEEIIPIHFGEKEGNYYAFHKSGNLAAVGEYHFDHKVGLWREYYDIRNRRKREIFYSKDPFDDEFSPYIIREWDKRGKLIYERKE